MYEAEASYPVDVEKAVADGGLAALDRELNRLDELVERTHHRLSPIIRRQEPSPMRDEVKVAPVSDFRERIDRLSTLISRLDRLGRDIDL
jgi:hypothetical protein